MIGTLVDLPTITETYKTKDETNFFKSNDICQMIWVNENLNSNENKNVHQRINNVNQGRKVYEQKETVDGKKVYQVKVACEHGLTPPTFDIRKDFYRYSYFLFKKKKKENNHLLIRKQ